MGISLEQPRQASAPVIRHTGIGQELVGALVNVVQRDQQRKTNAGWETIRRDDGRPKREEVVTYMVVGGNAQVGVRDSVETRTVEPGELVRYIYKGLKWSQRIDAYKSLGDGGGMQVGDVHQIKTTGAVAVNDSGVIKGSECVTDEQVIAQRLAGRNVTWNVSVAARRARPEEAQRTRDAEAHYAALTTQSIALEHSTQVSEPDPEPF